MIGFGRLSNVLRNMRRDRPPVAGEIPASFEEIIHANALTRWARLRVRYEMGLDFEEYEIACQELKAAQRALTEAKQRRLQ